MNAVLSGSQWLRRSGSNKKAGAGSLGNSQSGTQSTLPLPPPAAQMRRTNPEAPPASDSRSFEEPLWPTYEPPMIQHQTQRPSSAISDAANSTNNWTLDLGLSTPSRARKTSSHSNGRAQLLANATDHAKTSFLALVGEIQPGTSYSTGSKQKSIARRTSKESSAGGSDFSHAHVFEESESHELPLRNETPHSHHTFGGSSRSGGIEVDRRRGATLGQHGRRASSPSIVASSSHFASVASSRSEAESLPAGTPERVRALDSVASECSVGLLSVASGLSRAPSGRAGTFDAGSFEWRASHSAQSRITSRPTAENGAISSAEACSPLQSEHDSSLQDKEGITQGLTGEKKPRSRVESMPDPDVLHSSSPSRGRRRHLSLPARNSRARARSEGPPRVRVRSGTPLDMQMFDVAQANSDPFQESRRDQPQDDRLWAVYPSSRAALGYSSSATLLCARESTHSILTFITASPRLSSTFLIEPSHNVRDPFSDAFSSSSSVHVPWPEIDDSKQKTACEHFEEESVWIPLPIRPVHKSLPTSHRPVSASFLSAPPRELRRNWRNEQREKRRQSAHDSRREQLLDVPSTLHEVWAAAEQSSPITQEPLALQDFKIANMPEFEMTPSLQSSRVGWISRSISLGRLALVPLGGWCFVFGFICPPLWWIGAVYPRRRTPLTPRQLGTSPNHSGGPISEWPDTRPGARKPLYDRRSRGGWLSSGLSRCIEGTGRDDLPQRRGRSSEPTSSRGIEGGPAAIARSAAMEREAAPWEWRRRNRVMSLISAPILSAIIAATIWACVSGAFVP
ncbi:BZ3500_MvSof-1268-A1-R1_Chr10-1g02554 [Microbotryum saponariae]|uniref:BZ3500_MvSof-1268-A1-R1_Chr10-1g02554 protein n=1 Tax=Microbotryum saponariae TaxID=289078 RepID=A0A2X0M2A6_9BASI|nr:BZ3500_MvSof-1268-A1-R1_Chr10-1g02554 [Microbotryum saponariae]SDA06043.1 BZ3501_MvSof-1269-A2-R1_Chr10-1g02155 [Microbotryum saponariae]